MAIELGHIPIVMPARTPTRLYRAGAMAHSGRLITIEGIDGTGKTTLAQQLGRELSSRGLSVVALREPGGVEVSERIRAVVADPSLHVHPRTEALLYAAARAQIVQEAILPALQAGSWVLLDRFVDSSLAYQGAGRGLGIDRIRSLNAFATSDLTPDRTLLLTLETSTARARQEGRGEADRLEREQEAFFTHVSDAYLELARAEPERFRLITAAEPPNRVLELAIEHLRDLF